MKLALTLLVVFALMGAVSCQSQSTVNVNFANLFNGVALASSASAAECVLSNDTLTWLEDVITAFDNLTYTEDGNGNPIPAGDLDWDAVNELIADGATFNTSRPSQLFGQTGYVSFAAYWEGVTNYYDALGNDLDNQVLWSTSYTWEDGVGGTQIQIWNLPRYNAALGTGANDVNEKFSVTVYVTSVNEDGLITNLSDFPNTYLEVSLL